MSKPLISIIIPTYNRPNLLEIALKSIVMQKSPKKLEIIVVDNHPAFTAQTISNQYKARGVQYVIEKKLGHSFAKNKGLANTNGEWCIFLDDDARLPKDWAINAINLISSIKADIFGGPIVPYFENVPPVWFKPDYESRVFGNKDRYMESTEFLATSSTLIRTKKLKSVGGFNNQFGIKGDRRRFGEDTDVLRKLRVDKSVKTYYSPKLAVEHFTPPEKTTIRYRAKHHFNLGASGHAVSDFPIPKTKIFLKTITAAIKIALGYFVAYTARDKTKYSYPQNYVWEKVSANFYWFGRLIAKNN